MKDKREERWVGRMVRLQPSMVIPKFPPEYRDAMMVGRLVIVGARAEAWCQYFRPTDVLMSVKYDLDRLELVENDDAASAVDLAELPGINGGDTVRLRSGGTEMTVLSISGDRITCTWRDSLLRFQIGDFHIHALELVKR